MQTPEHLHLHLLGQADETAETQIAAWRSASSQNEAIYQDYAARWQRLEDEAPHAQFDVDAGWQNLQARLGLEHVEEEVVVPFPTRRRGHKPMLLAVAAIMFAALGVLFFRDSSLPQTTLTCASGETLRQTLPDGSVVVLRGGSQISFAEGFMGKDRVVRLQGQAWFEVVKGDRSFVVQTNEARVRVVGTRFDVWTGLEATRVVVDEGRVAVTSADGQGEVVLGSNQRADIGGAHHTPVVSEVTSTDFLAWKDGKLLFRKQALHHILIDLERTFDRKMVLDQSSLGARTLTAEFDNADLDNILADICLSLGLDYRKEGPTYTIFSR